MTIERLSYIVVVTIWIISRYRAEREISRLREKVDMYNERAYVLGEFIKDYIPSEAEHAKQVLAEKTKWRNDEPVI